MNSSPLARFSPIKPTYAPHSRMSTDSSSNPHRCRRINAQMMQSNQIFVTDVGVRWRCDAFFWMALGNHVYDHKFDEISISDLERDVDPNDVMNPVILRGHLWKKLHARYWQVDDGRAFGPLPSQPGMDARLSNLYYGDRRDRRARQAISKTQSMNGLNCWSPSPTSMASPHSTSSCQSRRRTKSVSAIPYPLSDKDSQYSHRPVRTRSLDRLHYPQLFGHRGDSKADYIEAQNKLLINIDYVNCSLHTSLSLDSAIDLGSDEDMRNMPKKSNGRSVSASATR